MLACYHIENCLEGLALMINDKGEEKIVEFSENKVIRKHPLSHACYEDYKELIKQMNEKTSEYIVH